MIHIGLFENIKGALNAKKKKGLQYARTMNGVSPQYYGFGDSIYASDLVVQSIRCKANEFKKLQPRHIIVGSDEQEVVTDSSVAKVLNRPNPFMTTADLMEKIAILLELNKNVFIYPTWYETGSGKRIYTGLYPLKPTTATYLSDDKGNLSIDLNFANGDELVAPVGDIIHIRKDYGVNDYFGGGMFGGNDDAGLLTMLQRYDALTESIAKALDISCQINGVMQVATYSETDAMRAARLQFEEDVRNNKSGILFIDQSGHYENIPHDVKLVDPETLKFFYETILRANGTSLAVLNGDYTTIQKSAYYEHAIESHVLNIGQAFSKCLFSDREESFGNRVIFYPKDINFMSMENKIQALQVGLPAGIFTKDEARELLGYAPLPNGAGKAVPQGYNNLLNDQNQNTNTLVGESGGDEANG